MGPGPAAAGGLVTNRPTAVYGAEDQVSAVLDRGGVIDFHGSRLDLPMQRRFGDLDSVRRYLTAIRLQPWGGIDAPLPSVRCRRGPTRAHWTAPGEIALPESERWAMTEMVLLHEYTHHLQWHRTGATTHDRDFCVMMCDLVAGAVSPSAALVLRAAYDAAGAWE